MCRKELKISRIIKAIIIGTVLVSTVCYSAVSDNDGSDFITKGEYDTFNSNLKNTLFDNLKQIDNIVQEAINSYIKAAELDEYEQENLFAKIKNTTTGKEVYWLGSEYWKTNWKNDDGDTTMYPGFLVEVKNNVYGYWVVIGHYNGDTYGFGYKKWSSQGRQDTGCAWTYEIDDGNKYLTEFRKGIYSQNISATDYKGYGGWGSCPFELEVDELAPGIDGLTTSVRPKCYTVVEVFTSGRSYTTSNVSNNPDYNIGGYTFNSFSNGNKNYSGEDIFFGGRISTNFPVYNPNDEVTYKLDSTKSTFQQIESSNNYSFGRGHRDSYFNTTYPCRDGQSRTGYNSFNRNITLSLYPPVVNFAVDDISNYYHYGLFLAGFEKYNSYSGIPIFKAEADGTVNLSIKNYSTVGGTVYINDDSFSNVETPAHTVNSQSIGANGNISITVNAEKAKTYWIKVHPNTSTAKIKVEITNDKIMLKKKQ